MEYFENGIWRKWKFENGFAEIGLCGSEIGRKWMNPLIKFSFKIKMFVNFFMKNNIKLIMIYIFVLYK